VKPTRMPDLLGLADDLLAAGSLRSFTLSLRRVAPPSDDDGQTVTIDLTITAAVQYGGDKVAPFCSDVETTY